MHSEANPTISTAGERTVLWNIPSLGMFSIKAVYSTVKLKNHLRDDSALFLCSVPVSYVYIIEVFVRVQLSSKALFVRRCSLQITCILLKDIHPEFSQGECYDVKQYLKWMDSIWLKLRLLKFRVSKHVFVLSFIFLWSGHQGKAFSWLGVWKKHKHPVN